VTTHSLLGEILRTIKLNPTDTEPINCLQWNPSSILEDVLAIATAEPKLYFMQADGTILGKPRILLSEPTCIDTLFSGQYILIAGSDYKVTLYTTADAIHLGTVAVTDSWISSICVLQQKQNVLAIGSIDGCVVVHQIMFNTVHALYKEIYAYRENMTEVVVQNLHSPDKLRLRCKDLVKKVSVYQSRLAVQLSDKILIYEHTRNPGEPSRYRVKEKISNSLNCSLLVVTSMHTLMCFGAVLRLYNNLGELEHEWTMESFIRYVRCVGGPPGNEGVLIGLKSGQVLQVYISNPFPILHMTSKSSIRCLDINSTRTKIAVVDEAFICSVYELQSQKLLFSEPNALSVAWNLEHPDILAYSWQNLLSIKTGTFQAHSLPIPGFVVGFYGSKVYVLDNFNLNGIEVPNIVAVDKFMENNNTIEAFRCACLGVTDSEWKRFGMQSLEKGDLLLARKAFMKVKDHIMVDYLMHAEQNYKKDSKAKQLIQAEYLILAGKIHEVSSFFAHYKFQTKSDPRLQRCMYNYLIRRRPSSCIQICRCGTVR